MATHVEAPLPSLFYVTNNADANGSTLSPTVAPAAAISDSI